jgi:protein-tyrosine phosphatase
MHGTCAGSRPVFHRQAVPASADSLKGCDMQRHIDFEAIENFRDFGGYETVCGRRVVAGRLYRSGHHGLATEADLARLEALDIGAIADLRLPSERAREPGRRWAGFGADVIESDAASIASDWVEALHTAPLTADWWFESTLANYRLHAFEPRHIEVFRRLLRHIADGEGAVVVHCAAGKDRTGVACALVHHIAGVPNETMIADYLLTNDEARIARKMAHTGAFVENVTGRRPTDEALRVAVSAFPKFLGTFFESIREAHGSIDAYLETVLGVDERLRGRIRERILG